MTKASGRKRVLVTNILLIIIAVASIPILCFLIPTLDPNDVSRDTIQTIMLIGCLVALPYQLVLLVGAICGIVLCNTPEKYLILVVFSSVLLILAILIGLSMFIYAPLMIPTIILLIINLTGIAKNKADLH